MGLHVTITTPSRAPWGQRGTRENHPNEKGRRQKAREMLAPGDGHTCTRGHAKGTASSPAPTAHAWQPLPARREGWTGTAQPFATASAPLQHPQLEASGAPRGTGRAGRLQRGAGFHCHFPILYLCSKGHSSVLGNCSDNLQERD